MKIDNIKLNSVPSITWNWLKSNNDTLTLDGDFSIQKAEVTNGGEFITYGSPTFEHSKISSGVFNISNAKVKDNRNVDGTFNEKEKSTLQTNASVNHPISQLVKNTSNESEIITISEKIQNPIILNYNFSEKNTHTISTQFIHVKKDCEATVIFVYKGNALCNILQTKILAEENAKLHIIKVQLLNENSTQLDDTGIWEEDNAKVKFTQIELGGSHVDSGLHVTLQGFQSHFTSNVAYLCQKEQFLDMNHIVYHYGKKTESEMRVNGTLKDNATKAYRGTIDFKNGCTGSKGYEMEETLILSPKTVNKSLPVILCDEDDIQGEHGSTIGRLSKEVLFYMQTRGISEKEAELMMSNAKINAVSQLIPDESIKEMIYEQI